MGQDLGYMYAQLVEKIEYQNREAAKHDTELKKGVFKLQSDIERGLNSNRHELHTLVKLTKAIIIMQVANFGVTSDTIPMLLKLIL
tara:strand:+ start:460 stop:717 length:258 start_codon:yes stop_codon:yes gene_type:complete